MVRPYLSSLLACAAASFLGLFITQVDAVPPQLYGINYNVRKGPDWASTEKKCKSVKEIHDDLAAISTVTKRIRIYSLVDCEQGKLVLEAAAKIPEMQVELGLWVSGDVNVYNAERTRLLELIQDNRLINTTFVSAIHVGSEAIYRKEVNSTQAIDYMKEIKRIVTVDHALAIPITIADIGDIYDAHPDLIDVVDFISANGFPFWENKPVVGAAAYLQTRMQSLMEKAATKNKPFVISETGWPTDGVNVNASIASRENAAIYLKDFLALASNWKYYYFEAFDEPWKITLHPDNTVEGYFGIFHANRTLKSEFNMSEESGTDSSGTTTSGGNGGSPSANSGATSTGNNGASSSGNNGATSPGNNGATSSGNNEAASTGTNGATSSGNTGATSSGNNGASSTTSGPAYHHPDCPV